MQINSLEKFQIDINNIREYIKHIDLIHKVANNNRNSDEESLKEFIDHLYPFNREKKLFEYKAIIISIYGVLEKYISIWIKEHIETLSSLILNYQDMPKKLSKSHFDLSIKLISIINENRFAKYEHLSKEEVLTTLSSCINEPLKYKLNNDAFSPMSGNLKHSKIVEAFKTLDINLESMLKQNDIFSSYLESKFGENIANRGVELFNIIDDLVVRRNDIAHGTTIDNITSDFDNYIEFLEYYGKAIFDVLLQKEIEYETIHLCTQIEKVISIYKDTTSGIKSILAFELNSNKIAIGDFIIIKTDNGNFYKQNVSDVQQDNINISAVEVLNTKNVGIKLDTNFNLEQNSQTFYIKKRKS